MRSPVEHYLGDMDSQTTIGPFNQATQLNTELVSLLMANLKAFSPEGFTKNGQFGVFKELPCMPVLEPFK